ncbi:MULTISPECIES: class I adenylate-forming enzyme family protein [unclassified Bradyrhizobium]|uniref:class I adenylate-forming enzyme family protein n=1 Tax=unclassified Bradyrhizobium TaxID=2631580 RepID=UPI001BAB469B|nr:MULTISPECIES: class I adenylate-forming enzyme family protein [unclassified Bradyrhizobium]MBR1202997.1 acyl--CoA ligase [Bradyrhizobium sp. AUGA SZCCT0124]MBR1314412.1 acyl--CoA ligase [Bradyrhizobium sp. AUGA SZCCT0051]MBR1342570.1 acyl--CoA ligase [Bradyrhizobium sp. AUGA SZCCT0105]MBR1352800.1 acyl--CoA ligase [Bradyrhizobium sp. AUGA SZCCT0045]
MGAWEVKGPARGVCKSWRDVYPELAGQVTRITAPHGRGIAWEGSEIWAYRDRPRSISECLAANVARWPDREAYVFHPGGERMTWGDVGSQVQRVAARLRDDFGFRKGDRLCLLTAGCPEYVTSYLAIIQLGGIAVPVNLGLHAEGLAAQINKVGAKGLVVSPEVWNGKLEPVRGSLESVKAVFVIGGEAPQGTLPFAKLTGTGTNPVEHEAVDEWDLCAISFTSGTTGVPKGTMALHINALGCAQNVVMAAKGLGVDDVNLCMPPLYHNTAVYADFLPALLSGGKCVIMAAFTPLDAIKLIEAERATWAVAAPIMLWMMMNHPEFRSHDRSTLKKIIFGGHASSETFINQLNQEFAPIAMVNAGSVSESTALGFALPTEDAIRKITSCGLATPNTDIAIFDDAGNEIIEPNVIGEVAYRGQQTNAGYWEEPGKTAEVFRRDGFVLSGDWARIDEEGYLWLLDRKKDMIVRGGQNVYCIEVENKLYLHPKVLRAAVVGVPDHVFSERLKAVVVLKPSESATADEIRDHCAKHLARYETPEYVVFATTLPANAAGKTLKPPLVDFWGESGNATLERFAAFCASMPPALFDMPHLKIDGKSAAPREVLAELEEGTDRGRTFARMIEEQGICALTTPNESRFRK